MSTAPDAANLVENYFALARKIAAHWATAYPHLACEFESTAAWELWKTATAFDPADGIRFATKFHRRCRYAFLYLLKRERAKHPLGFLPQTAPTGEGKELHPLDFVTDKNLLPPDEAAEHAEDLARIPAILATLQPDRAELVVRHVGHGETAADLGAEHGATGAAIRDRVAKSLKKLRQVAAQEG